MLKTLEMLSYGLDTDLQLVKHIVFYVLQPLHIAAVLLVFGSLCQLVLDVVDQDLQGDYPMVPVALAAERADQTGFLASDAD